MNSPLGKYDALHEPRTQESYALDLEKGCFQNRTITTKFNKSVHGAYPRRIPALFVLMTLRLVNLWLRPTTSRVACVATRSRMSHDSRSSQSELSCCLTQAALGGLREHVASGEGTIAKQRPERGLESRSLAGWASAATPTAGVVLLGNAERWGPVLRD